MVKLFFLNSGMFKRIIFFITIDGGLLASSLYIAFFLNSGGEIRPEYIRRFPEYIMVFLVMQYLVFSVYRLYAGTWLDTGRYDLPDIIKANAFSLVLLYGITLTFWQQGLFMEFPYTVLPVNFFISTLFISIFRASGMYFKRFQNEEITEQFGPHYQVSLRDFDQENLGPAASEAAEISYTSPE